MFHIPVSTLRYYDKEGLFPNLERKGNIRKFSDAELDQLHMIECLKKSGLEIKEIKQFFKWTTEGSSLRKFKNYMTKRMAKLPCAYKIIFYLFQFHIQKRIWISLFVTFCSLICFKAKMLIKSNRLRILFIHCNFPDTVIVNPIL